MYFYLGTITTGGIAFQSAEMDSMTARDFRFSGTPKYISLIEIGTPTSSRAGQPIQAKSQTLLSSLQNSLVAWARLAVQEHVGPKPANAQ